MTGSRSESAEEGRRLRRGAQIHHFRLKNILKFSSRKIQEMTIHIKGSLLRTGQGHYMDISSLTSYPYTTPVQTVASTTPASSATTGSTGFSDVLNQVMSNGTSASSASMLANLKSSGMSSSSIMGILSAVKINDQANQDYAILQPLMPSSSSTDTGLGYCARNCRADKIQQQQSRYAPGSSESGRRQ